MLKIKDNVDLKELEKYGFKYVSGDYETQDLKIKALFLQTQRLIYDMPKE